MTAVAILNLVLVVVVSAGIVSLLGWSIVADKARVATGASRQRNRARANPATAARQHRSPARSFS